MKPGFFDNINPDSIAYITAGLVFCFLAVRGAWRLHMAMGDAEIEQEKKRLDLRWYYCRVVEREKRLGIPYPAEESYGVDRVTPCYTDDSLFQTCRVGDGLEGRIPFTEEVEEYAKQLLSEGLEPWKIAEKIYGSRGGYQTDKVKKMLGLN